MILLDFTWALPRLDLETALRARALFLLFMASKTRIPRETILPKK
ncbi:hypothetical protein ACFL5O_06550 [Myxococcota bacterium]